MHGTCVHKSACDRKEERKWFAHNTSIHPKFSESRFKRREKTMNVSHNSNAPLAPCLRMAPLTPGKKRRESLTITLQKEVQDEDEHGNDAPVKIRHVLRKSHSYDDAPQIPSRSGSPTTTTQPRPITNRKHSLCSMTESRWSDSYPVMISSNRKLSFLSRESSMPVTPTSPRRSFTKPIRRSVSPPEIVLVPAMINDEDYLSDIEQ